MEAATLIPATPIPATPVSESRSTDELVAVHTLARMFTLLIQDAKKNHPELDFFDCIEALAIAGTTLLYEQSVLARPAVLTDQQFRHIADRIGHKLAETMNELATTPAMELIGMTTFLATMARWHNQKYKQFSRELEKKVEQSIVE
jgi:hypothetical protein